MTQPTASTRPSGTMLAFIAIAFAMVGLIGLFATFAAPLPLQRAIAREGALDAVLAAGPNAPATTFDAMRPALDDSADAVLPAPGQSPAIDLARRVADERVAMRGRMERDAEVVALRLRWLICLVTLMAAIFSVAMIHAGRRQSR